MRSRLRQRRVRVAWIDLLKLPQTWGTIIAKSFTDPVFFFITEWFPIYLVAKGIELKSGLIAVWIPFVAADAGELRGGMVFRIFSAPRECRWDGRARSRLSTAGSECRC